MNENYDARHADGKNVRGGNEAIFGDKIPNKNPNPSPSGKHIPPNKKQSSDKYTFDKTQKSTEEKLKDISRKIQAEEMKKKTLESQLHTGGARILGKGGSVMSNVFHDSGFSHSGGGSHFGGGAITLKVEPIVLKNKAIEVEQHTKALETEFESIQDIVAKTASYWIGIAGDKARQDFVSQKDDTATIIRRFMEHPVDLLAMAGVYEETERQVTERNQSLETDVIV